MLSLLKRAAYHYEGHCSAWFCRMSLSSSQAATSAIRTGITDTMPKPMLPDINTTMQDRNKVRPSSIAPAKASLLENHQQAAKKLQGAETTMSSEL